MFQCQEYLTISECFFHYLSIQIHGRTSQTIITINDSKLHVLSNNHNKIFWVFDNQDLKNNYIYDV